MADLEFWVLGFLYKTSLMSLNNLLFTWINDARFTENVECWYTIPAKPPLVSSFPDEFSTSLRQALNSSGIKALYTHQLLAYNNAVAGNHIIICTGTASGKSLCYNLPVLRNFFNDPDNCALYIFPTKALSLKTRKKFLEI
jgi:DEAD/DEAH box helicase domain-containing protein